MNEMTFYKAAERYERKLSDKGRACDANKRSVLKRLKSFIGDVPLSEIDRMLIDDLHSWLATTKTKRGGNYAVSTIANHLGYLKALLRWANEAGKLDSVPVIKVPAAVDSMAQLSTPSAPSSLLAMSITFVCVSVLVTT